MVKNLSEFNDFKAQIEDLIDELFHGTLNLGNNEHFRDLMMGNGDDTKTYWRKGLKKIFDEVKYDR